MVKILFLIHDLGQGGAEKVLVNLVNNMDHTKFDITVMALFGGGINEKFLSPNVHYRSIFKKMLPANSQIMKLFSPAHLHNQWIKDKYDIEVSYLEGPSSRIISGCPYPETKKISWIHVEQHSIENVSYAFKNSVEAVNCYNAFDRIICVSKFVKDDFCSIVDYKDEPKVLYNTVESDMIRKNSSESADEILEDSLIRLVAVGTLKESKGYGRMLEIMKRLHEEGYPIHLYILGEGPMKEKMQQYIQQQKLEKCVTLLGYQTNPYKYIAKCDLFLCASFAEGFSTAVTEALILGVPVCTVKVSGMTELLGEHNEYGIVTDNDAEALYKGVKQLLDSQEKLNYYREKAKERGFAFNTEHTVKCVEDMLMDVLEDRE